jgi:hypothetical protein
MKKLKRRILLEVKSLSVIFILFFSFVGYSQGIIPYTTVSDTLMCWDLKGSKKLYSYTVKAKYSDSLNAVNDSIIKSILLVSELSKTELEISKKRIEELNEEKRDLKSSKWYSYSILSLLGLAIGLIIK